MAIDQPVELKADPVAVRGRLGSAGSHSVLDFLPGGILDSMGYNHRQVLVWWGKRRRWSAGLDVQLSAWLAGYFAKYNGVAAVSE